MYFEPLAGGFIGSVMHEGAHNARGTWQGAAAVVYAWTDRREASLDQTWWRNHAPLREMGSADLHAEEGTACGERLTFARLLQLDPGEANELFAELASRSSCRRHASLVRSGAQDDNETDSSTLAGCTWVLQRNEVAKQSWKV